jgi:hypothetical protein
VKYTCPKKPNCTSKRILVSDTNETLWSALVELFLKPERIHDLVTTSPASDLDAMKKELVTAEREQKTNREKQERLLNLYLEGNVPQATYVLKSSQLEAEGQELKERRSSLTQRIQSHGKRDASLELIQTLRLLARSHKRFTDEQKTKVFRSIVKEARIVATGVELEMYVQPTQNVWWKYRQKKMRESARSSHVGIQTVRIRTSSFAR